MFLALVQPGVTHATEYVVDVFPIPKSIGPIMDYIMDNDGSQLLLNTLGNDEWGDFTFAPVMWSERSGFEPFASTFSDVVSAVTPSMDVMVGGYTTPSVWKQRELQWFPSLRDLDARFTDVNEHGSRISGSVFESGAREPVIFSYSDQLRVHTRIRIPAGYNAGEVLELDASGTRALVFFWGDADPGLYLWSEEGDWVDLHLPENDLDLPFAWQFDLSEDGSDILLCRYGSSALNQAYLWNRRGERIHLAAAEFGGKTFAVSISDGGRVITGSSEVESTQGPEDPIASIGPPPTTPIIWMDLERPPIALHDLLTEGQRTSLMRMKLGALVVNRSGDTFVTMGEQRDPWIRYLVRIREKSPDGDSKVGNSVCFWKDAADHGGGWRLDGWYGWLNETTRPVIRHLEHGWQYIVPGEATSVYIFDYTLHAWLWTSETYYPNVYRIDNAAHGWLLYLEGGSPEGRWFYHYDTGKWILEPQP